MLFFVLLKYLIVSAESLLKFDKWEKNLIDCFVQNDPWIDMLQQIR